MSKMDPLPLDKGLSDEALAAYADLTAALIGLPIPEDCRPGVLSNLRTLCEHAALVMSFPLDPQDEAMPGFQA
ncbi:MAG: DUF4089 domain-containing protein [Caulobacteraceae bacterium]|nr:DUF4089 domain-containing protein [Caulobacteraceae bacterium]